MYFRCVSLSRKELTGKWQGPVSNLHGIRLVHRLLYLPIWIPAFSAVSVASDQAWVDFVIRIMVCKHFTRSIHLSTVSLPLCHLRRRRTGSNAQQMLSDQGNVSSPTNHCWCEVLSKSYWKKLWRTGSSCENKNSWKS